METKTPEQIKKEASDQVAEQKKRMKETDEANGKLQKESDEHMQKHQKSVALAEAEKEAQQSK